MNVFLGTVKVYLDRIQCVYKIEKEEDKMYD